MLKRKIVKKSGWKKKPYSEETKQRMKEKAIIRWNEKIKEFGEEELKRRMASFRIGKKMSEEAKEKIRIFQKKKIFSEETRKKISESKKGSKHHNWKGGIENYKEFEKKRSYYERTRIMCSREYKNWRKSVFERDNYTCIWCGEKENLCADHIKSFTLYEELRFELSNGRTLCKNCHKKTDDYGRNKKYQK